MFLTWLALIIWLPSLKYNNKRYFNWLSYQNKREFSFLNYWSYLKRWQASWSILISGWIILHILLISNSDEFQCMFFSAKSTIKWDTIKCEGKHIWLQHLMSLKCQSKNSYDIVPWNSVPFSQIFKVSLDAFQSTLHIWHHLIVTPDRVMTEVISVTGDTQLLLNFWSEQVAILRPRLRFWTSDMVCFSLCHNENGKMLTWAYRYCPSHFTEFASLILKAAHYSLGGIIMPILPTESQRLS